MGSVPTSAAIVVIMIGRKRTQRGLVDGVVRGDPLVAALDARSRPS